MYAETYKTRAGTTQYRPVVESTEEIDGGFCLACGAEGQAAEPDARKYVCDSCGQAKVYGMEELVIMGLLKLSQDFDA